MTENGLEEAFMPLFTFDPGLGGAGNVEEARRLSFARLLMVSVGPFFLAYAAHFRQDELPRRL